MSGGIAILLALIVLVVLAVIGIALYLTGGAISLSNSRRFDREQPRPEHKEATSPEQEHTHFVGAPGEREE